MRIFQILIALIFCIIAAGFVFKSAIPYDLRWPLLGILIGISVLILKKMAGLKIFYFENSGFVFTIKYYHPAKKGIIFPLIEYPVDTVRTFKIERSFFTNTIIIDVSSKEKSRQIRIKVADINDGDYYKMANSLK
ncbi:hypothetical protein [Chryseobacterium luteum]|uniref:Uncharacterized protein n=1 Tax=Chryseobacterium luteum TaxID=421531 RepID=A0A085ZF73_9FLAO|nr:hypothetical protein [Chryseobacterium luteum]KFF03087.1 hypothetical protein IX38_11990 [Chryseobacterium luteum]